MNSAKPITFGLEVPVLLGTILGVGFAVGLGLISARKEAKSGTDSELFAPQLPPKDKPFVKPWTLLPEPILTQPPSLEPDPAQPRDLKVNSLVNEPDPAQPFEPELDSLVNEPDPAQPREPKVNSLVKEPDPAQPWEPELDSLVNEPAVLLYGAVGSGKSSKAGYLVTQHLQKGHQVEIVNPLNKYKQYQPLKVWGSGNNFADAGKGVGRFSSLAIRRLQKRAVSNYDPFSDEHHFLLLEEVTNWESKMNSLVMSNFFEACTQYLRQANMSVALVSHGKTLTCIGGEQAGRGKKDTLLNQFVRLNCQAKHDPKVPGGKSCAGWAMLEWNEAGKEKTNRINIPNTWQPPNRDYDYSEYVPTSAKKEIATIVEVEPEKPAPGLKLPPHMQSILDYSRQQFSKYNQPLKARDVQRSGWQNICSQNLTPEAIRLAFQLLAQQGYGVTQGEDSNLSFIPNVG